MRNLAIFRSFYESTFDEFYTRLKSKKTKVIERYLHLVEPKGFLDKFLWLGLFAPWSIERIAKYNATRRVLEERLGGE